MGIGGSIFLIAVGAIIAFGVRGQSFGPFDLNVIGWVLMIVGFVGLALTMYIWSSRRRRVVVQQSPNVERHYVQPPGAVVDEETWTDGPPDRRY
jgi:hypothetical protein